MFIGNGIKSFNFRIFSTFLKEPKTADVSKKISEKLNYIFFYKQLVYKQLYSNL